MRYCRQMGKRDKTIEDDADLWARVAETATPLTAKNRLTKGAAVPEPGPASKTKQPERGDVVSAAPQIKTAPESTPKVTVKKSPSPTAGLDRQTARKLDKGHLAVQARLDLHGMRQREAHSALRKFLHWARGKDYRHVLVITGKGSGSETSNFYEEEARGVLRQSVPHWLANGDLAPLIVSFSEAPRRLGGGGALYVRLRKGR